MQSTTTSRQALLLFPLCMVQCPCWSSCVQCSSQDLVPKCPETLTFMSAMSRSSIYMLNYQCPWCFWYSSHLLQDLHQQAVGGKSVLEPSWNFTDTLSYTSGVYVGLQVGKKPLQWRQERHMCVYVLAVCHFFVLILVFTNRLWLYVGFNGCLLVDYTHELMVGMQLPVDRNALKYSVWKEQTEMFL